jgi:hypothetical protein
MKKAAFCMSKMRLLDQMQRTRSTPSIEDISQGDISPEISNMV